MHGRVRHLVSHLAAAAAGALVLATGALAAECDRPGAAETIPACRPTPPNAGGADFAILIVLHLTAAEMNCPYRIEEGRVRRLLAHYGMGLGDSYTRPRSKQLGAEVDKIMESFRTDRQKACDTAWKHFGPAATFEGFLQPR